MKKPFLEAGVVVGTHGLAGEMRVKPWTDSPDVLTGLSALYTDAEGKKALKVLRARTHKTLVLLTVEGVESIEAAERYRGKLLFARREDLPLPEGSHFIQDLLGCEVRDAETDRLYGVLSDVSYTGANDVWHIRTAEGREYLIPAIDDVVRKIDTDAERIEIIPLKGIFDDED